MGTLIEPADPRAGHGASGEPEAADTSVASRRSPRPLAVWISTFAGVGFAPFAPGTFGSAAAVLLFPFVARLGPAAYSTLVVAITLLGVWASDRSERFFRKSDDGRIVIDEVAGQWIALAPVVMLSGGGNSYQLSGNPHQVGIVVTGFVLFRCFDIWKPGPVRWAERGFRGGWGVMADDVVAGLLAAALVIPIQLLHGGAAA